MISEDTLFKKIEERVRWFEKQAKYHKKLNRALWGLTTLLSITVAILANVEFDIGAISASEMTAVLAIILPAVTGYTVLRSPESLWVLEVDMRNRLQDLKQRLILVSERNPAFDRAEFEEEYLAIMGEANKRWREIKESQGGT